MNTETLLDNETTMLGILNLFHFSLKDETMKYLLNKIKSLTSKYKKFYLQIDKLNSEEIKEIYTNTSSIENILINHLEKMMSNKKLNDEQKQVIIDYYIALEKVFNKIEDKITGFDKSVELLHNDKAFIGLMEKWKKQI